MVRSIVAALRVAAVVALGNSPALNEPPQVFVMLGLTTVTNDGKLNNPSEISAHLDKLKQANVDGFMVDVWWGVTEKSSKNYDFSAYKELVQMASQKNLRMQMVTSFHQCGGNVGDACNIPLPSWVLQNKDIWFTDQHGNEDKEYISFFADDVKLEDGRTPMEMYADWMSALAAAFASDLGKTIVRIQVGAGPCGELRYPSYMPGFGWKFPGIGVFQVYDKYARASLTTAGSAKNWTGPPSDAGDYNSQPQQTGFFNGGYQSDYGKFFLDWYLDALKTHGGKVLDQAALAFKGKVGLAAKIAGVHWWYGDNSHAAEVTAGYYNTNGRNAYKEIAEVFAKNQVALDFTCLEMRDSEQDQNAKSRPEELVQEVISAAASSSILFSGENALPRYDDTAYQQILKYKQHLHAFTYLRLSDELLAGGNYDNFRNFVQQMHSSTYEAILAEEFVV